MRKPMNMSIVASSMRLSPLLLNVPETSSGYDLGLQSLDARTHAPFLRNAHAPARTHARTHARTQVWLPNHIQCPITSLIRVRACVRAGACAILHFFRAPPFLAFAGLPDGRAHPLCFTLVMGVPSRLGGQYGALTSPSCTARNMTCRHHR